MSTFLNQPTIHLGALERRGCMGVDVVTVPKFQQPSTTACGVDGLGHYIIRMIRAGMAQANTSLLYILERLNGEGAWVVGPLTFSLSKTAGRRCWHVEQTVQDGLGC